MMKELVFSEILFPQIDEAQTAKRARKFLERILPQAVRASSRSISDLRSPRWDDMPKAAPVGNGAENANVDHLDAERIVHASLEAMRKCSPKCREILEMLYLQHETDTTAYVSIGYSKSQYFDKWKPLALVQFAQGYDLENLRVYQNRTQPGQNPD